MTIAAVTEQTPEWATILEALRTMNPGDVLTYTELDGLLSRDFRSDRAPLYTARNHLLDEQQRTLICEPNKGYRIATADEHTFVARSHERRAGRQVKRASQTLIHVRVDEMSPDRLRLRDTHIVQLAQLDQLVRALGSRVRATEVRQDMGEEMLERIESRLVAIEDQMGGETK